MFEVVFFFFFFFQSHLSTDTLRLSSANTEVPAKVSDNFLLGDLTENRIVSPFWRDTSC